MDSKGYFEIVDIIQTMTDDYDLVRIERFARKQRLMLRRQKRKIESWSTEVKE